MSAKVRIMAENKEGNAGDETTAFARDDLMLEVIWR